MSIADKETFCGLVGREYNLGTSSQTLYGGLELSGRLVSITPWRTLPDGEKGNATQLLVPDLEGTYTD